MHSTNYLLIQLMIIDAPRMLTEDEKTDRMKKANIIEVKSKEDLFNELRNQMLQ